VTTCLSSHSGDADVVRLYSTVQFADITLMATSRTTKIRVVVGGLAMGALSLLTASAWAAPPPPDPVPASLTCATNTYSYVQVLELFDRKGNVLGTDNLECGTSTAYEPFGYPSEVSTTVSSKQVFAYGFVDWTCADTPDQLGGSTAQTTPVPLAKKGPTVVRCASPLPGGSDVTLSIGS
jgi:hypothetical protein